MTHSIERTKTRPQLISIIRDMKPGDHLQHGDNLIVECLPQGYRVVSNEGNRNKGEIIFARTSDFIRHLDPLLNLLPNIYKGFAVSSSPSSLRKLTSFIIHEGHESAIATDPKKAFYYVKIRRPDFIILDLTENEEAGREFLKNVRMELKSYVPIITLTNTINESITEDLLRLGADDVIKISQIQSLLSKALKQCLKESYNFNE